MANSGIINLYPGGAAHPFSIEWSVTSTDPYTSTSIITWRVFFKSSSVEKLEGVTATGFVTIDGVTKNWSARITTDGTVKDHLIYTGNHTIQHYVDGSKPSVPYEAFVSFYGSYDTKTGSITLDRINRSAYVIGVSPSTWTDEANPVINYTNPAGEDASTVEARIIRSSGQVIAEYRDISKTGTSYTFTLTDAERRALRAAYTTTATTIAFTFQIHTIVGGQNYVRSFVKSCDLINYMPTLRPTIQDTNSATIALTGEPQVIVKYYSNVYYNANPQTQKGANIAQFTASSGSVASSYTNGYFNAPESGVFDFSLTDTRGHTLNTSVVKPFVPYVPLTGQLEVGLLTGSGTLTVTVVGKYYEGKFGTFANAKTNSLQLKYLIEDVDTADTTADKWVNLGAISPYTDDDNNYSYSYTIQGLDNTKQYALTVVIKDALSGDIELTDIVGAVAVFDWSKKDFRFNVPVYMKDNRELDYVIEQYKSPVYSVSSDGASVPTNYEWNVRKWSSGFAESWCSIEVTVNINSAWGGLFTSGRIDATNLLFPFTFNEIPCTSVTLVPSYAGGLLMTTGSGSKTVSRVSTGTYEIARGTSYSNATYTLHYNVKGYWK